jgi:hypothetical protein
MPDRLFPPIYDDPWAVPDTPAPDLSMLMEPPPEYVPPELLGAPPLDFGSRLALGLSQIPPYQQRPYESGGTRFGRGLISGMAGGFSRSGVAGMQRQEQTRTTENAARKDVADRNYGVARKTWELRLGNQFKLEADKAGDVPLTPKMWQAMGIPADPAIKTIKRDDFIAKAAQYAREQASGGFRADALTETQRHNRVMETRPVGRSGQDPITPGGYTPRQIQAIGSITDNVRMDPDIKDFVTIRDNYKRMSDMAKLDSGQGDLSIIFAYMKVLDPTSVVREQEYNNAAEAIGKLPQLANIPRQWKSGQKLTPAGRQGFLAAAQKLYEGKKTQYDRAITMWRGQAEAAGIKPELVLRDYTAPAGTGGAVVPPGITEMVMDPKTGGLVPKVGR